MFHFISHMFTKFNSHRSQSLWNENYSQPLLPFYFQQCLLSQINKSETLFHEYQPLLFIYFFYQLLLFYWAFPLHCSSISRCQNILISKKSLLSYACQSSFFTHNHHLTTFTRAFNSTVYQWMNERASEWVSASNVISKTCWQ
jgi:hypothetical protein